MALMERGDHGWTSLHHAEQHTLMPQALFDDSPTLIIHSQQPLTLRLACHLLLNLSASHVGLPAGYASLEGKAG